MLHYYNGRKQHIGKPGELNGASIEHRVGIF